MFRLVIAGFAALILSSALSAAQPQEDTLRGYLRKSDVCLSGTFTLVIGESGDAGGIHYHCELEVGQVIAGQCSAKKVGIGFVRLETKAEEMLPFLKDGGKCILFLKRIAGEESKFALADAKWGIQPFSEELARAIGDAQESRGPEPAERVVGLPEPTSPFDLSGDWLLTMPAGFEYAAKIERVEDGEKDEKYRLSAEATNLRGVYEWKNGRLTLVKPASERMEGLAWEIKNKNVVLLVDHPESAHVGADYRNATLTRSKMFGEGK